ncbi:SMI1 / KNR4 family (SUKH-1) [Acinetobacter marinus]|uniref:SMI1 / KNR4 family (SUKH-1) n=1 Tax=Acinetobacter marinus TaxID=281375 RepID=A0A1G6MNL3_9GAMM|nr:SMI1/KNR4 family protein [Acinetobacter marinus]SDC56834.1 SMI1 / KNR4 family (SUKH-1) [Acinetobacter marinus]
MPFPIDEKYILQTEHQLGLIFPPCFKAKMIQTNGGEVIADDDLWQLFPFFDQADKKRIKRTCNHITVETKQAQKWHGFPTDAIAIASNGSGDLLIFKKLENVQSNMQTNEQQLDDTVYRWSHETAELKVVAQHFDQLK